MVDRLLGWLHRLLDVRRGERRALAKAFATLLLLIAGHTALETARDALVLTRLPSRELGVIYVAVAICVLPAAWVAARASERFGVRATLGGGLVTAATLLAVLFAIPTRQTTSVVVYVVSALVGAILVPQYWNLLASMFNVAQARRLLGIVGTAAVLGGVLGSTAAAALLNVVRVKALLLVSAGVFLTTVVVLAWMPVEDRPVTSQPTEALPSRRATAALREEPFLQRIALLVVVATAAGLFVDYFFKWTVTRTVPQGEIARFVATYYAWLNGLSLVAQVFLTGALVRRIGVATTMMVTPTLLFLGGVGSLVTGGALVAVLVLKAVDGTLRNSVQRITMELAYLPVPAAVRARAKPFIDGALARVTQASVGAVLLALGGANYLSSWLLAGIAVAALGLWVVVAVTTRRPYLELLRHAVTGDALIDEPEIDPIDLESSSARSRSSAGRLARTGSPGLGTCSATRRRSYAPPPPAPWRCTGSSTRRSSRRTPAPACAPTPRSASRFPRPIPTRWTTPRSPSCSSVRAPTERRRVSGSSRRSPTPARAPSSRACSSPWRRSPARRESGPRRWPEPPRRSEP
ncbi:MAG: MFS transporter [Polyangiaceae bacterium]